MTLSPLVLPAADDAQGWVEARARDGLAAARELVDGLRTAPPATTLDLLRRLGRSAEAREAYDAAIASTDNTAERAYLSRRRGSLAP